MRNTFLLLILLLLGGCAPTTETFMKEIRYHSEDANLRANTMLSAEPELRNYADRNGRTPLHAAVNYCNYSLVIRLLKEGADPNAQDKDGNTPLHLALNPQVIKDYYENKLENPLLLRKLGGEQISIFKKMLQVADKKIKNNDGKTPGDVEKGGWSKFRRLHGR